MSVALNEICELIVDCPHSTAFDEGSGYPLIRTPNIGPGYFDLDGVHRVGKTAYDKRNQRAIPRPNDLIMAREAPAGNVAIIPEGAEFCLGQRTVLIRPDASKVYPLFLNYYLNAPEQRHKLLRNANGATVSHVNMPIIRNLPIDLPSIEEQKRVASMLAAYDSLIENNRKQIKLLEEAAQRLYKEWFIDLRFPGHESATINSETALPEGWTYRMFLDAVSFTRGRSYSAQDLSNSGKCKLVNLSNIAPFGGWQTGGEKPYSGDCKKEQIVQGGNLVMAVTDMTKERRLVGHVGMVPRELNGSVISMDLIKLDSVELDPGFLYGQLRYSGIASMISMLANGTNVLHLKPESLSRVQLLSPKPELQEWYGKAIQPILCTIDCINEKNTYLVEARNRLIPILLSEKEELQ